MFEYFDKVRAILNTIETEEKQHIQDSIEMISNTIQNQSSIFIFGASHAGILSEELYYRAGGLMLINPIFGKELMLDNEPITMTSAMEQLNGYGVALANKTPFNKGDVLIVHSVSGRNPVTIDLAIEAKKRGVKIIGITNLNYSKEVTSRHVSGKNLYEYCDIVIDNHGEKGDACISIEGLQQKVSPTSTVIGASIVNTIVSQVAKDLKDNGIEYPPIFYSANVDGGSEKNKELMKKYKSSIHYKYD